MKVWVVTFECDTGEYRKVRTLLFQTQRIARKWIWDQIEAYKANIPKRGQRNFKLVRTNTSWTLGFLPRPDYYDLEIWGDTYTLDSTILDFEKDCLGELPSMLRF